MLHAPSSETKTEATQSKATSEPLLTREQHPPLAGRANAQRPGGMSNQMQLRSPDVQQRQQATGAQQTYGNQGTLHLLRQAAPSGSFLQRAPAYSAGPAAPRTAPPIVQEVLRSPGQTLDEPTRAFMEPRFGTNFSRVRVHKDAKAAASARAVNALAYTIGRDVVFGADQYQPETSVGKRILAHELAHVVQQSDIQADVNTSGEIKIGMPSDPAEQEAEHVSDNLVESALGEQHVHTNIRKLSAYRLQRLVVSLPGWGGNEAHSYMAIDGIASLKDEDGNVLGHLLPPLDGYRAIFDVLDGRYTLDYKARIHAVKREEHWDPNSRREALVYHAFISEWDYEKSWVVDIDKAGKMTFASPVGIVKPIKTDIPGWGFDQSYSDQGPNWVSMGLRLYSTESAGTSQSQSRTTGNQTTLQGGQPELNLGVQFSESETLGTTTTTDTGAFRNITIGLSVLLRFAKSWIGPITVRRGK